VQLVVRDPLVEVRQVQEEHYGRSYRIRYRCEAGGAPKRELRVRVLDDDGDERYADAFDVSCAKATGLAVSLAAYLALAVLVVSAARRRRRGAHNFPAGKAS